VAGCCECGDEPSGSGATELVMKTHFVFCTVARPVTGCESAVHTHTHTQGLSRSVAFCDFLATSIPVYCGIVLSTAISLWANPSVRRHSGVDIANKNVNNRKITN
jgi:hypothetical protein